MTNTFGNLPIHVAGHNTNDDVIYSLLTAHQGVSTKKDEVDLLFLLFISQQLIIMQTLVESTSS
jgi:hypothetical protein